MVDPEEHVHPHPQLLGMNYTDTLIEQSVTLIRQLQCSLGSIIYLQNYRDDKIYFNFVMLLLLPSTTMALASPPPPLFLVFNLFNNVHPHLDPPLNL